MLGVILVAGAVSPTSAGQDRGTISLSFRDVETGYALPALVRVSPRGQVPASVHTDTFEATAGETVKTYPAGEYAIRIAINGYEQVTSSFVVESNRALRGRYMLRRLHAMGKPQSAALQGPPFAPTIAHVAGYVTDDDTGRPLKDVRVEFERAGVVTYTDVEGRYTANVTVSETQRVGDEEIAVMTESVVFSRAGFVTRRETGVALFAPSHVGRNMLMFRGAGEQIDDRTPKIFLSAAEVQRIDALRAATPADDNTRISSSAFNRSATNSLTPVQPPARIKIGFSSTWECCSRNGVTCGSKNCGPCSQFAEYDLEDYVSRGWVGWEWIGSWGVHSLRSGSVAYRSYGAYHVYNPDGHSGTFYDLCSSCACQMFSNTTGYTSKKTAGILLHRNGGLLHAEYSAHNNNLCPGGTCSGGGFMWTSCGDGFCGRPSTWPCLYDPVESGYALNGHGGGMSQWGTYRWEALYSKTWPWIVNHYYNANAGADGPSSGDRTAYMTSPLSITSASPSATSVSAGQTFTINISANNVAGLAHEQVLVGASLSSAATGTINDSPRDIKVVLSPGASSLSRSFQVPNGTASGTYDLIVGFWLDVDENGILSPTTDLEMQKIIRPAAITVGGACYTLYGVTSPSGAGTITIDTPPNCQAGYTANTLISLRATPVSGYSFSNWSASGGNLSNPSSNPTTFTITANATVTAAFSVASPPACSSFTITPSSASPGSTAGSQSVTITGAPGGCQGGNWSASGNGTWLSVAPSAGSGSASATVSWTQNSSASARSGSATITGRTFTVTQAAAGSGGAPHAFIDVTGATAQVHSLGVANDGSVFVLFGRTSPRELAVAKSTDGGASWSTPVVIPGSDYSNSDYRLAVDPTGTVHVVWALYSADQTFYSRSTDGGSIFSVPIEVRSGTSVNGYSTRNSVEPVVAADGAGNVYVAYGAFTKDVAGTFLGYNIWVSKSTNGGVSFQPEFPVNAISSTQKSPRRIRATASSFWILYLDETNSDLYFHASTAGAFANNARVNPTPGTVMYSGDFDVAGDATTVFAVYADTTGDSEGNITFCKSSNSGAAWSNCTRVNDSVYRWQTTPAVALDSSGGIHTIWSDLRSNQKYQIYYAYSGNAGSTFSANVNLSEPFTANDFTQPRLAVDHTNAALYISATRDFSQVMVARRAASPEPPAPPCTPAAISTQPSSRTIASGTSTTLDVTAGGTAPLSYQWYVGSSGNTASPISGATGSSITVTPTTTTSYWVRVTNSCGSANSVTATVSVNQPPPPPPPPGPGPRADFDGDLRSELLLRNSANQLAMWDFTGRTVTNNANFATVYSSSWRIEGFGDFDGDGKHDILFRYVGSTTLAMWLLNGRTIVSQPVIGNLPSTAWEFEAFGDFNGDGRTDALARNPVTGEVAMWEFNGTTVINSSNVYTVTDLNWRIQGTGDFNADGDDEVVWRNIATQQMAMWEFSGRTLITGAIFGTAPGAEWAVRGIGDFDADGRSDILWQNTSTLDVNVWDMNYRTIVANVFVVKVSSSSWRADAIGDYDGDGGAEVIWFHTSTAQVAMWELSASHGLVNGGLIGTISGAYRIQPPFNPPR